MTNSFIIQITTYIVYVVIISFYLINLVVKHFNNKKA